jgi:release factor glutamine methyltransferase
VLKDDPVTRTQAIARLRESGCVFAEEEAAVLIEAAAGNDQTLAALVERRATGEPLEQVAGYADFCGVRVRLRPGVFVPRVRSELLVRLAVKEAARDKTGNKTQNKTENKTENKAGHKAGNKIGYNGWDKTADKGGDKAGNKARDKTVVDLCCGSGALGLAVLHQQQITLHSADLDPTAVATARDNLVTPVYEGDLFAALPDDLRGHIDVLIANVPYVATHHIPLLPAEARDHEPPIALDGGPDGLDVFRRITTEAPNWLAPGGVLLSEITAAQLAEATEAVNRAGLDADSIYDDDLEARVIRGRRTR